MPQFYFLKRPHLVTIERYSDLREFIFETKGNLELLFVLNGMLEVTNQNSCYALVARQLHISQTNTIYTVIKKTEKLDAVRVVIDGLQINGYVENQIIKGDISILTLNDDDADFIISNCLYLQRLFFESQGVVKEDMYTSILSTILLFLLDKLNINPFESYKFSDITQKAKKYIEDNFTQDITLTMLADQINFSVYYLAHIFKKETGISPIQYLMNCRMEKAKELLQLTNNTIFDIAQQVGYVNTNYFNMLFKRIEGVAPGRYRNKYKKIKS